MLNKNMNFLIVIIAIFLVSCNPVSEVKVEVDNNTVVTDIFKHHHSVSLYQFGEIINKLSNVKSKDDLIYIDGMVDIYLKGNPLAIPTIISQDKNEFNNIVDQPMQEEVLNLYKNEKTYIQNIKELLGKRDIKAIQAGNHEFNTIYNLERQLNDNRLTKKEDLQDYKKSLEELNKILRK